MDDLLEYFAELAEEMGLDVVAEELRGLTDGTDEP